MTLMGNFNCSYSPCTLLKTHLLLSVFRGGGAELNVAKISQIEIIPRFKRPLYNICIFILFRFCEVIYYPSRSPDLCWEAVRTCPKTADSELKMLCEDGPANYINITTSKLVYRNQFCAVCHGENLSPVSHPNDFTEIPSGMSWNDEKMVLRDNSTYLHDNSEMLMALEPKLQVDSAPAKEPSNANDFTSFRPKSNILCSFFMDATKNYCDERFTTLNNNTNDSLPVWELGSLACLSQYPKVCDLFVVPEANTHKCTTPGCGPRALLDPSSLKCHPFSRYDLSNELLEHSSHKWHSHDICAYQSQCRSAELGLVKFEHLNCYCDELCMYYNDCCEDSKFQATTATKLEAGTFKCKKDASELRASASEDGYYWGIMQVDRCPSHFANQTIRTRCEDKHQSYTPFYSGIPDTPVSHVTTGLR